MKVNGKHYRTIWVHPENPGVIQIIDQRHLPHQFVIEDLSTLDQTVTSIKDMHVRGAPLIGIAAAYGIYLALLEAKSKQQDSKKTIESACQKLKETRPTAVNLAWALECQRNALAHCHSIEEMIGKSLETARHLANQDVEMCKQIGVHSLKMIEEVSARKKGLSVNILTHCNAGWLACVDWGTKTSGIYQAFDKKIPIHVWVDETRPRNQGASLTAWEFSQHGIPHTVVADNAGGHLMQRKMVDLVFVGSDRVTQAGDVANKIGTYLKALAAKASDIPFYVAFPSTTIDWTMKEGLREIPIEERSPDEVSYIEGFVDGSIKKVRLTPPNSPAFNPAFDVTPASLITGLITERGIAPASKEGLLKLFPEKNLDD